jgi:CMP-N,N'-diacetyllegionaminic acid synthase
MNTVAIIPARGGSKGIPKKNLIELCGQPLISWSILQAKEARHVDSVWVTSDSDEILAVAEQFGARAIKRPPALSSDDASSESAWLHALDEIEKEKPVTHVVAMQATSPLREASDIDNAVDMMLKSSFDSLLSVCEIEDFFMWKKASDGTFASVNYDYKNRKRRQNIEKRYLENGSFYIFKPEVLRQFNNRLGNKIGGFVMERHKMFQVDNRTDLFLVESLMRSYKLDQVRAEKK